MELNSNLALRVYRQVFFGVDRPLGYTLGAAGRPQPLPRPTHGDWYVRHDDDGIGDAWVARLAEELRAQSIPGLSLAGCAHVTDEGLAPLGGLAQLGTLDLFNTAVGDRGLAHLAGAPALRSLNLAGTAVTDAVVATLASLPRLERLHLGWTAIGDGALAALGRLPSLRALELRGTQVTDAGVAALAAAAPRLEALGLAETVVGDAAVAALRPLAGTLQRLDLGYSAVTDACVDDLQALVGLRTLVLRATAVGAHNDAALRHSLARLGGVDTGPDATQEGIVR